MWRARRLGGEGRGGDSLEVRKAATRRRLTEKMGAGSCMSPQTMLGDSWEGDSWEVRRAAAGCRRATRASSGENGFDTFPPICGRAHTHILVRITPPHPQIQLHPLSSQTWGWVLSKRGCNLEREDAPDLPSGLLPSTLPPDISTHLPLTFSPSSCTDFHKPSDET